MRRYSSYFLGVYVGFVQLLLAVPSLAAEAIAEGPPNPARVEQLAQMLPQLPRGVA